MAPVILTCFKAKVYRPVRKAEHAVFKGPGIKSFQFGGQLVVLKPIPPKKTKRFEAKKLISPSMWKDMLKKTIQKEIKKVQPKKERAKMKEVVLRAEKTIKIAMRESLEDYCKEYCKEGLPGKKHKARKIKAKVHRSEAKLKASRGDGGPKEKKAAKNLNFTVITSRYEHIDHEVTIGDPKSMMNGPFTSYTLMKGGDGMIELPPPSFEELIVEATVQLPCEEDETCI